MDFPAARCTPRGRTLAVADGKLIVGGDHIEAFDLATRTKLDAGDRIPWDPVRSLAVVADTLLVGGEFRYSSRSRTARPSPASTSRRSGRPTSPSPRFAAEPSGWVNDIEPDGTGGVFLAGYFQALGTVSSDYVGHLDASGEPNFPDSDGYGAGAVHRRQHALRGGRQRTRRIAASGRRRRSPVRPLGHSVRPGSRRRGDDPLPDGELLPGGSFRSTSHNASSGIGWFAADGAPRSRPRRAAGGGGGGAADGGAAGGGPANGGGTAGSGSTAGARRARRRGRGPATVAGGNTRCGWRSRRGASPVARSRCASRPRPADA